MPLLWAIRRSIPWWLTEAINWSGTIRVTSATIVSPSLESARARVPSGHRVRALKPGRRDGLIEVWLPKTKESA